MVSKKNRLAQKTVHLCAVILMASMSVSGQDTTAYTMPEVFTKMLNSSTYKMDEVVQMAYDHHREWFGSDREPAWEEVRAEFSRKYPEMNVDSLRDRARFAYFQILVSEHGREEDLENRVKALAHLANTYGERWAPDDLTSYARDVIRFDYGHDQDALRWTQMALEKITDEDQLRAERRHTLARILAKMGRKEEALKCIADALPGYPIDDLYMKTDGTYDRGLQKKRAMSDLFEILADRGRWLDADQRKVLYKGKVDFEEDKLHWHSVRDNYLLKEFPARQADSLMYMGAMYYYDSYLSDTLAWIKPFVEYAETYGNIDSQHKNQNAWELFKKSDQPRVLEKALKWSEETLKEKDNSNRYAYLDTYANLQYKLGDKVGALKTIGEAISLAPDDQKATIKETREQIKNGKRTW